jgi:hypothetical protein
MAPAIMGDGLFSFLSRRRFLKVGLGGAGVVLAGGGGVLGLRGCAPDVQGLRILSNQHYRTLLNLARTHLPHGGPFDVGAEDVDLARAFDNFLADEPQRNIDDLGSALTLIELGPMIFDHRLATFSNLEPPEQLAHWRRWLSSDTLLRRQAALAFRKFFNLVFFDTPQVWPHIGYNGPSYGG